MSFAVSTIVALHGLTSKLVESCQDRKLAAELRDQIAEIRGRLK